jgi:CheY-like chemotaxis protein
MCVDDDPDIRMILEFSLTALGAYLVCLCSSGQSALAEAPVFKPDLVLLDVMMPGLSGPQTLAALRTLVEMKRVPVVFLTAKAMPDEIAELLRHGAAGVIIKPFDPVKLPQELQMYWEHGCGILPD